ncbi:MAG: hypothetical protein Q4G43_15885 [Mobilicoccus sp.]|nr:hypothetical protein [Mobilicoccus sp.]
MTLTTSKVTGTGVVLVPADDGPVFSLDDVIMSRCDAYADGWRDGHAACEAEQAARHRAAAEVVGATIRAHRHYTDTVTDQEMRARAAERERASIARFRAAHASLRAKGGAA